MKPTFGAKTNQKVSEGSEPPVQRKITQKSIQTVHQEILKNIESTNIGKPTIVEAQRILRIIEHLYENLNRFIYLDADFISRFLEAHKAKLSKELYNKLSDKCRDLLTKQAELESKYRPFLARSPEEQQLDEEKQKELENLQKDLTDNF